MKTLQVSDEAYEGLKPFVVDPFDDTPSTVLTRLMNIVSKTQACFCPIGARLEDRVLDTEISSSYPHSQRAY